MIRINDKQNLVEYCDVITIKLDDGQEVDIDITLPGTKKRIVNSSKLLLFMNRSDKIVTRTHHITEIERDDVDDDVNIVSRQNVTYKCLSGNTIVMNSHVFDQSNVILYDMIGKSQGDFIDIDVAYVENIKHYVADINDFTFEPMPVRKLKKQKKHIVTCFSVNQIAKCEKMFHIRKKNKIVSNQKSQRRVKELQYE